MALALAVTLADLIRDLKDLRSRIDAGQALEPPLEEASLAMSRAVSAVRLSLSVPRRQEAAALVTAEEAVRTARESIDRARLALCGRRAHRSAADLQDGVDRRTRGPIVHGSRGILGAIDVECPACHRTVQLQFWAEVETPSKAGTVECPFDECRGIILCQWPATVYELLVGKGTG